jgi:hypothetical protein
MWKNSIDIYNIFLTHLQILYIFATTLILRIKGPIFNFAPGHQNVRTGPACQSDCLDPFDGLAARPSGLAGLTTFYVGPMYMIYNAHK